MTPTFNPKHIQKLVYKGQLLQKTEEHREKDVDATNCFIFSTNRVSNQCEDGTARLEVGLTEGWLKAL